MTDTTGGRAPHYVDQHVGRRMRELRRRLNVSQEQLAQKLGLTFQQVQKYETGANRVSASRLFEVAGTLGVDVDYFFRGLAPPARPTSSAGKAEAALPIAPMTAEAAEIDQLFLHMQSPRRRLVLKMARALTTDAPHETSAEPSIDVELTPAATKAGLPDPG